MALDIFSSFDDHNKVFYNMFIMIWIMVLAYTMFLSQKMWSTFGTKLSLTTSVMDMTKNLYSRTLSKNIGGSPSMFNSLFMVLVLLNLLGLVPYVFSLTSHLAINLAISMPMWTMIIFLSVSFNLSDFLAHLQPMGSPALLNPFLCLIELVSLMVRPLTLAVRLTANLSTGHILMSLLGTGFTVSSPIMMTVICCLGMFYFIFEMAVCVIQSYIFTLLPTLYMDEHPNNA